MRYLLLILIAFSSIFINTAYAENSQKNIQQATFAGGCFWCMEKPFDVLEGVLSTTSGYMGGHVDNPTYKQVSSGTTGHYEVLQVAYDAEIISFPELIEVFWKNIDPTDSKGQFCDKGQQYTSAAFYHDEVQHNAIKASLEKLQSNKPFKDPIATKVLPAKAFYAAEEYHQDYYLKNPLRYKYYRFSCGRDNRLKQLWGEPKK